MVKDVLPNSLIFRVSDSLVLAPLVFTFSFWQIAHLFESKVETYDRQTLLGGEAVVGTSLMFSSEE